MLKAGDIVTIKKEYDPGLNQHSYPYGFTPIMLSEYGGTQQKISSTNGYVIHLKNALYIWHETMFEGFPAPTTTDPFKYPTDPPSKEYDPKTFLSTLKNKPIKYNWK